MELVLKLVHKTLANFSITKNSENYQILQEGKIIKTFGINDDEEGRKNNEWVEKLKASGYKETK